MQQGISTPLRRQVPGFIPGINTLRWLLCLLFTSLAQAQSPPTTNGVDLQVTVTGVEGMAQVRDAGDKPWRKCEIGMTVSAGAEFRTGPRSAIRCQIPPDQTITIDRLGVVKVLTAIQEAGGKVKTDVAMTYGRTRYDIEQAGIEHESVLRSPSSTLAIRGTRVSLYDQPPFTPRAVSLTGRAVYGNAKRLIAFGGKGQGKTTVNADTASAAETAARIAQIQTVIDTESAIQYTQAESRQLAIEVSRGGIRFDRLIIGGFVPPPTDLAAAGFLPGKLNFVATWSGFADIDLFVIESPNSPEQKILGNPSISKLLDGQVQSKLPSGGRIDFDKISTGKGEFEVAYWPSATYKGGVYGLGAIHQDFRLLDPKYDAISNVKLEVYLDGKKLDSVVTNPDAVRDKDAPFTFGTTYQTQTNLNAGRDVVSTLVVIPDPNAAQRSARNTSSKSAGLGAASTHRRR